MIRRGFQRDDIRKIAIEALDIYPAFARSMRPKASHWRAA